MQVFLENIAFNHDPDLSKTGSFFLRRNETQVVPIPEWRNECCLNPECAPAGYVISQLPDMMTIKASFRCDVPQVASIRVRALEITAAGPSILGAVEARPVTLQDRHSGLVEFNLPKAKDRITAAGVSVSDVTWQWQFSTATDPWKDFQTTEHRIYCVAQMPHMPWNPASNNVMDIQVPWTQVLNHACVWAAGLTQQSEIAGAITRSMHQLGQEQMVKYGGSATYALTDSVGIDRFDCTAFLQLLKGHTGNGQRINCDDCATIVSTFSNILGCNLFQSDMGDEGFIFINPILLIGHPTVHRDLIFFRHAVAWELNCDAAAPMFDACLQVDTDGTPGDRKHNFSLPTDLGFDSYRSSLVADGKCDPQPATKKQRAFGSGLFGHSRMDETYLNVLKRHYKFDDWDNRSETWVPSGNAFADWNPHKERRFENEAFSSLEALLKLHNSSSELVEITIYETKPPANPKDFLLQLLGSFEPLYFERGHEIGELSFVAPEDASVLFKRNKFAVAVRSVGFQQTPVKEIAAAIDFKLQQHSSGLPNTFGDLVKSTDIIPK